MLADANLTSTRYTMLRRACAALRGRITDPETGLTFGYLRYTETQSNRVFVTVECLYGFKVALAAGIKRIVKP